MTDPFNDHNAHLKSFPDSVLRDIARNECAPHDYRKDATEILMVRKSPLADHEDLRLFVIEIRGELEELQFEFPAPEEVKPEPPGPLRASVTTATMFGEPEKELDAGT